MSVLLFWVLMRLAGLDKDGLFSVVGLTLPNGISLILILVSIKAFTLILTHSSPIDWPALLESPPQRMVLLLPARLLRMIKLVLAVLPEARFETLWGLVSLPLSRN